MKSLIIYIYICLLGIQPNNDLKISLDLVENKTGKAPSRASGDRFLQYNYYRLSHFISELTGISESNIYNKTKFNPFVNFKVTASNAINKDLLIEKVEKILLNKFEIKLTIESVKKNIKVLKEPKGNTKLEICTGNKSVIQVINRTYKAECIPIEVLVERIREKYNVNLVNDFTSKKRYNFIMHEATTIEEYIEELDFFYSIPIVEEERFVDIINLHKK